MTDDYTEIQIREGSSIDSIAKEIIKTWEENQNPVHLTVRSSFDYHRIWDSHGRFGIPLNKRLNELGYQHTSETRKEQNGRIFYLKKEELAQQ